MMRASCQQTRQKRCVVARGKTNFGDAVAFVVLQINAYMPPTLAVVLHARLPWNH